MNKHVIMTATGMELTLQRIAMQILEANRGADKLALIGIYTCGHFLAGRIAEQIFQMRDARVELGSLDISLYRDDWSLKTQHPVVKTTDIPFSVTGRRVVLIDDVLFTGRTVRAALDAIINDYGRPLSIQLATLIDRGGRELPIQPDFSGLHVTVTPDERIQVFMKEQGCDDEVCIERSC